MVVAASLLDLLDRSPTSPFITNPLDLSESFATKLAKNPQLTRCKAKDLIGLHGTVDLEAALRSYLIGIGNSKVAEQLSISSDHFDVWTRAHVLLPPIRDLTKCGEYMTIICSPESTKGWRKKPIAAQFSTVLIIRDREASGIHRKH